MNSLFRSKLSKHDRDILLQTNPSIIKTNILLLITLCLK